ncbi:unnamed protein product [Prorocentrum cordatum]|uniref:Uncharacterized protein n=1 Tax=Prorocentrum cordatum TaxID=2364126 RepID=A0ABN9X0U4_9DINO|nr:unnamed protein product [Polarella glacialis]
MNIARSSTKDQLVLTGQVVRDPTGPPWLGPPHARDTSAEERKTAIDIPGICSERPRSDNTAVRGGRRPLNRSRAATSWPVPSPAAAPLRPLQLRPRDLARGAPNGAFAVERPPSPRRSARGAVLLGGQRRLVEVAPRVRARAHPLLARASFGT